MHTCLINYTPFKERKEESLKSLRLLGIVENITVINRWDREDLDDSMQAHEQIELWEKRISTISPILMSNVTGNYQQSIFLDMENNKNVEMPSWTKARKLTLGELSVLLKHYYGLSMIANSRYEYGLISKMI